PGQADVRHEAAGTPAVLSLQELLRPGIRFDRDVDGAEQVPQALAHSRVVLYDVDLRVGHHGSPYRPAVPPRAGRCARVSPARSPPGRRRVRWVPFPWPPSPSSVSLGSSFPFRPVLELATGPRRCTDKPGGRGRGGPNAPDQSLSQSSRQTVPQPATRPIETPVMSETAKGSSTVIMVPPSGSLSAPTSHCRETQQGPCQPAPLR